MLHVLPHVWRQIMLVIVKLHKEKFVKIWLKILIFIPGYVFDNVVRKVLSSLH